MQLFDAASQIKLTGSYNTQNAEKILFQFSSFLLRVISFHSFQQEARGK